MKNYQQNICENGNNSELINIKSKRKYSIES